MPYITLRQEIMLNLQFNRELMRRLPLSGIIMILSLRVQIKRNTTLF